MTTNTNTKQTRQTDSTNTSTDNESNHSYDDENEIALPSDLEQGPDGEYRCPADGCDWVGEFAMGVPHHHFQAHDASFTADLFGEETWVAYLRQEHVEKGRRPPEIAREFDAHIGATRIRAELEEHGLYFDLATGNVPEAARILLHPDVNTIADAQRVAAKRRGEL